jgi:hypothetical protein
MNDVHNIATIQILVPFPYAFTNWPPPKFLFWFFLKIGLVLKSYMPFLYNFLNTNMIQNM